MGIFEVTGNQRPAVGSFQWTIDIFSKLKGCHIYSHIFTGGGYDWQLLLYPQGIFKGHGNLSLFLVMADRRKLRRGWNKFVDFTLTLVNQKDPVRSTTLGERCKFDWENNKHGYYQFKSLEEIHSPTSGFLVNDTIVVEAHLNVLSDPIKELKRKRSEREDLKITKSVKDLASAQENAVETEDRKPDLVKFRWWIDKLRDPSEECRYSKIFTSGGIDWKITVSKRMDVKGYLAIYLEVADYKTLPTDWRRDVTFSVTLVNQHNQSDSITHGRRCMFKWGGRFNEDHMLEPLRDFRDDSKGFLVDDSVIVGADVLVHPEFIPSGHESTISDSHLSRMAESKVKLESLEEMEKTEQSLEQCLALDFLSVEGEKEQATNYPSPSPAPEKGFRDDSDKPVSKTLSTFGTYLQGWRQKKQLRSCKSKASSFVKTEPIDILDRVSEANIEN